MRVRITSLFIFAALIFVSSADAFGNGKSDKGAPKLQWQDANEYIIGGFHSWAMRDSTGPCDSCGIRIYVFTNYEEAPLWIVNHAIDWRLDTVVRAGEPLELFIPDSLLRKLYAEDGDLRPDTSRVYDKAAFFLHTYPLISGYVVAEYPGASDGYTLTESRFAGKEYILASYKSAEATPPAGKRSISYTSIVGIYDKTQVSFKYGGDPNGFIISRDGKILTAGLSDTLMMNRGDVWHIPAVGPASDITGSYVSANKPVQCFTGSSSAMIPKGEGKPGFIIEDETPYHLWNQKYYVAPFKGATSNPTLRLFAAYDTETAIFRDGWTDQIATLSKKGGPFGEGWTEIRAAEGEPRAVMLVSDKPFRAVQYSSNDTGGAYPYHLQMNVLYDEWYGGYYAVKAPRMKAGPGKHCLNIIYRTAPTGTFRNNFMVGERNDAGVLVWSHISEKFGDDLGLPINDPMKLDTLNKIYCKQVEIPGGKTYYFTSYDIYYIYSYGSSEESAYGYPVLQVDDMYLADTIPPAVYYTMDSAGNVPDPATGQPAYVKDMPDDYETRSNLGYIYFDKNNSYNYNFKFKPFLPGEDNYTEWSLAPINSKLGGRAVITFSDRAGNDTTLVIEHPGPFLIVESREMDYEEVHPSEPKTHGFKLINMSKDGSSLKPANLRLQKGDQGFTLNYSFDPEIPIAPGESRDFTVTFAGKIGFEEYIDSIGAGEGDLFSYLAVVRATGAWPSVHIQDANFDTTAINTTAELKGITISNYGSGPLVITGYTGPTLEEFKVSLYNWGISPEKPLIIQPGEKDGFTVYFTPREKREYLDSIVFDIREGEIYDNKSYLRGVGADSVISVTEKYPGALLVKVLPNPLDSRGGSIEFDNPGDGNVEIVLFNSLNQQVAVLANEWMKAGKQSIRIPVETLPGGAYTYRINIGEIKTLGKLVITK